MKEGGGEREIYTSEVITSASVIKYLNESKCALVSFIYRPVVTTITKRVPMCRPPSDSSIRRQGSCP